MMRPIGARSRRSWRCADRLNGATARCERSLAIQNEGLHCLPLIIHLHVLFAAELIRKETLPVRLLFSIAVQIGLSEAEVRF